MRKRVPRAKLLRELQDLVGRAKGIYMNDRAPDRADLILPVLDRAFDICVELRDKYKA